MSRRARKAAPLHNPFLRRGPHSSATTAVAPLPAVIRKGGFKLTIVKHGGRAAIYRQHLLGGDPEHDAYEVILPQVRYTNYKGRPVETYEGYPSAESWGNKGWTFASLAKAVQKAQKLAQKASHRGTASRRNRFEGQTRIRSRLMANGSCFVPSTKRFALPVGQRRHTLLPVT